MLGLGRGIESHNEMVAGVVCSLQFLRRLREEVSAPVGDATDNAALLKHNLASSLCDPEAAGVS